MIKNNPYKLLQEEGKTKDQLSQVTLQALSIYDETVEDIKKHPDQKSLLELAEQIGTEAIRLVKEEISSLDKTGKDTEEQKEKPEDKQKETHPPKPSPQKLDNLKKLQLEIKDLEQELEKCTQEGTLKKKAKQPQKPRKKTSQDVKVARNLLSITKLIPEGLKDNIEVKHQAKHILLETIEKLAKIGVLTTSKKERLHKIIQERFNNELGKVKIGNKNQNTIIIENHNSAYALVEDELHVAPLGKDGSITTDKFKPLSESPNHFKDEMNQILEALGIKSENKKKAILTQTYIESNNKKEDEKDPS